MDQEVVTAIAIAATVAMGVMVAFARRTRERAQEAMPDSQPAMPKPRTKRQRQLVASMAPPPQMPTIEELVAEEAAATGVNDIAGGEGLDVSLKLRVYWRDEVVRRGCEDGNLEFRVDGGISAAAADINDVRLVCVRDGVVAEEQEEPDEQTVDNTVTDGEDS